MGYIYAILHMVRVVLDSSVVVAAVRSQTGASSHLFILADEGKLTFLVSASLLLEYEEVLLRPEQMQAHGWSRDEIEELIQAIIKRAEPVEIYFQWRPMLTDPDDDFVLEVAVNSYADALVTHNKRHFQLLETNFRIPVLSPAELIRRLQYE
jgi:putative PIN family toxin of toxin-antitoxin system